MHAHKQLVSLFAGVSLAASSCGRREPPKPPTQKEFALSLGPAVLFELNSAAELLDTAPRADSSLFTQQADRNGLPTLQFQQGDRLLARFAEPTAFQARTFQPSPWSTSYPGCSLREPLQLVAQELSRIAQTRDSHSRIPAALLTVESCALQSALTCLLEKLRSTDWQDIRSAAARGLSLKAMVTSLTQCTGMEALWKTADYFEIRDGSAYFFPDPVVSVRIFEGDQPSYTWATDRFDSVAKVVNPECGSNCFASPVPMEKLTQCRGCHALEKGKVYTAFLQLEASEEDSSFRRIVFRAQ